MAYEASDYETITLERRGHVGVLTLNRPERLNAINRVMMGEVAAAVAAVKADDELRESVQSQLKFQHDRGTDVTIFSPTAGAMGHHIGTAEISADWSRAANELIYRVTELPLWIARELVDRW